MPDSTPQQLTGFNMRRTGRHSYAQRHSGKARRDTVNIKAEQMLNPGSGVAECLNPYFSSQDLVMRNIGKSAVLLQ